MGKIAFLFLTLSTACGTTLQHLEDYQTSHGLIVSTLEGTEVDPQQVEAVTELFLQDVEAIYGDATAGALHAYAVDFVASPFWCGSTYVYGGCHWRDSRRIAVLLPRPCLAKVAFVHELIHALEYQLKGTSGHEDPALWSLRWGVLGRVNAEAEALCGAPVGFVR